MSTTATEVQAPVPSSPDQATTGAVPAAPAAPTQSAEAAAATSSSEPTDKKGNGKEAKGKEAKGKKAKGSGSESGKDTSESSGSPSVAAHPRAARAVAQAKGWGGLAGFFVAGYLSLPTGTLAEAGLRALIAGSVCYVAAWAGAVFVWRRLVVIEIKGREQQLLSGAQAPASESSTTAPEQARAGAAS